VLDIVAREIRWLICPQTQVAVEKGTKAVISANFSACGERTFNNLRIGLRRVRPVGPPFTMKVHQFTVRLPGSSEEGGFLPSLR
jgi:hypothetical protein